MAHPHPHPRPRPHPNPHVNPHSDPNRNFKDGESLFTMAPSDDNDTDQSIRILCVMVRQSDEATIIANLSTAMHAPYINESHVRPPSSRILGVKQAF